MHLRYSLGHRQLGAVYEADRRGSENLNSWRIAATAFLCNPGLGVRDMSQHIRGVVVDNVPGVHGTSPQILEVAHRGSKLMHGVQASRASVLGVGGIIYASLICITPGC